MGVFPQTADLSIRGRSQSVQGEQGGIGSRTFAAGPFVTRRPLPKGKHCSSCSAAGLGRGRGSLSSDIRLHRGRRTHFNPAQFHPRRLKYTLYIEKRFIFRARRTGRIGPSGGPIPAREPHV